MKVILTLSLLAFFCLISVASIEIDQKAIDYYCYRKDLTSEEVDFCRRYSTFTIDPIEEFYQLQDQIKLEIDAFHAQQKQNEEKAFLVIMCSIFGVILGLGFMIGLCYQGIYH
jgi:hypothetical protein